VTSDKDAVVPEGYGPAWQANIKGARLATLHNAGHLAELDQPAEFARLVSTFLGHDTIAKVA
jgi:pimeloyl-ACP methyl ester carboxylesterase